MPDANLIIDYGKLFQNKWGRVYQGGGVDVGLFEFNEPTRERMLVQMAKDIGSLVCKDMSCVFFYGIDDGPTGVFTDKMLRYLINVWRGWIHGGRDIVFGCVMGVSRSSYVDIALMM